MLYNKQHNAMQVDKISKVIKRKPYFRDEQLHRVESQHPSYAQCTCLSPQHSGGWGRGWFI